MSRVVVAGSINADILLQVSALPAPGETVMATCLTQAAGGKGANQAHAAARTAAPEVSVHMIGAVGADATGALQRDALASAGVDVRHVRTGDAPTGTAMIAVDDAGENVIIVAPGANAVPWEELPALRPDDVVVLQLEIPAAAVAEAVRAARSAGARVVLNAAPAARVPDDVLDAVDVLVVNEPEARIVLGLADLTADTLRTAVLSHHPALVVTLGAKGAVQVDADGTVTPHAAYSVTPTDTVGAGDAFVGALAAVLAEGRPLSDAVRAGSAAGALTTTVSGARRPDLSPALIQELIDSAAANPDPRKP